MLKTPQGLFSFPFYRIVAPELLCALSAEGRASDSEYCPGSRCLGRWFRFGKGVLRHSRQGWLQGKYRPGNRRHRSKKMWAATKRMLALQDGPCILVAHSYGGARNHRSGETDPSVAGLVYVRGSHAGFRREKSQRTEKRFPSDLAKSGAIKKTPRRFHIYRPARSFMSTSQPTCLLSRPLSWRASQVLNFGDNFSATDHYGCLEK